ncbi:putative cytoplasmic protein [uncultured Pleomorphomonas sp.]|uniref:Putative cytoplasmic protein n=1 Tax=uncultured Pleomorphomonas sp. TaxID=442121 RepID=A0A212LNU5_9HYPH|nr:hypothetical protein [uncultured Pleomorphomonas sp.]SCM79180.1 putative cytoplasmic protein [uncultured Pleomorphomonas sp.]
MRLAAALLALSSSTVMAAAGELPACDDASVLATLTSRQAWAEAHTWKDGVTIAAVDRIGEARLDVGGFSAIDRRHCAARAGLTAALPTTLYYVVSAEGFAGYGWNVEFCLSGHDPYRVYGADCQVLK